MITVKNLKKNVGPDFSLKDISFEIPSGSIFTVIGKSGSGKSTLLRCLAGLESYTAETSILPQPIGMVFQSSNLFFHLTLEENIKLALFKVQKKSPEEAENICKNVLEKVQLSHRRQHKPHELSGGEQQRGAIARALAMKPKVILYDEPSSALDPELQEELFNLMLDLKSEDITQIVVSHEVSVARKLNDYFGYMNHGELRLFSKFQNIENQLPGLKNDEQKYLQLFL